MAACFVLAVVFTIFGWKQTGEMAGLVWMLVGIGLLLAALAVYNSPFADHGDQK